MAQGVQQVNPCSNFDNSTVGTVHRECVYISGKTHCSTAPSHQSTITTLLHSRLLQSIPSHPHSTAHHAFLNHRRYRSLPRLQRHGHLSPRARGSAIVERGDTVQVRTMNTPLSTPFLNYLLTLHTSDDLAKRLTIEEQVAILGAGSMVALNVNAIATYVSNLMKAQSEANTCGVISGTVDGYVFSPSFPLPIQQPPSPSPSS